MSAVAILKLQKVGFTQEQVEALAEYVDTTVDLSQLATKADLNALETAIRSDAAQLKSELELKIAETRSNLELKIAESRAEIIRWVVGIGFAQVATILAVLKLFPGAHP